jgi:predicted 3-demethylubiquinone-9 3-methyltransferase (glyoxalase superfamily)
MQKINPCLWFDNQAEEAVNYYVSAFKNTGIGTIAHYDSESAKASGRPEGSVLTVEFQLEGQQFMALNGGPYFTFSPAVSLFINCSTEEEIDKLWQKLSEGGTVLMGLAQYPFSKKYGWLNDKFGVSWQMNLAERQQKIMPSLMFVGEQFGKAEEAMNFYVSLFEDSNIINIARYGKENGDQEGKVVHGVFSLNGQEFMAMDSNGPHKFTFTPAISFFVNCQTQEEIDSLWEKLSAVPEQEQCGWLQDKYGVSWQIVPTILGEMLKDKDPEKSKRVMKAMLQMKKLDIAGLKQAYQQV